MGLIYNVIDLDRIEENINTVSRSTFGVFICRAGAARVSIGDKVYKIEKDVLFFYTPYSIIRILERSDDWDGMMLEEEADMLFTTISDIPLNKRIALREYPCIHVSEAQREGIMRMLEAIRERDELLEKRLNDDNAALLREIVVTLARAFCMELIAIYFDCTPVDDLPLSREAKIYNRFFSSAFDKCVTQRSVAFYAAEQNMSPGHFSTIIRNVSGRTAMYWIEALTMAKAKKMLADTTLSIKEIASTMAFPDQSTFGKYFKSRENIPPSEYRKRLLLQTRMHIEFLQQS